MLLCCTRNNIKKLCIFLCNIYLFNNAEFCISGSICYTYSFLKEAMRVILWIWKYFNEGSFKLSNQAFSIKNAMFLD